MANSKYEYVKTEFEPDFETKLLPSTYIVIRIDGHQFSEEQEFDKPNDPRALMSLMNACAVAMFEEFKDIVFAYGFGDEYSFVFTRTSKFYQRRASKILSTLVSFFSSLYVTKWNLFFSQKDLRCTPFFVGQIMYFPWDETLRCYLAKRQDDCHNSNQYNTCLWELVKSGKTKTEAQDILKGTRTQCRNELLFKQFDINYNTVPMMFRKGSSVFRDKLKVVVKNRENGDPVVRLRKKVIVEHCDIIGESFWREHPSLIASEDLNLLRNVHSSNVYECMKNETEVKNKLLPYTWIVVRIDGRHFHQFSDMHDFDKPNDSKALGLMNACVVALLEKFKDVIFAYGVSDEYSFVFSKTSQFQQRQGSNIVSMIVSFFSSLYVLNWDEFFPHKELRSTPSFDGRAICYPSTKILRDYLAWRQVDCHINNQYNTCFWMLVKSGKTKREAQSILKGTQTPDKNDLLYKQFGIDYNTLPAMFRKGSFIFRDKVEEIVQHRENGCGHIQKVQMKVIIEHCDIIGESFWKENPHLITCDN
ncbi:hypothetical protein IFM89_001161 [Coptis chinensis]|uniref:tRNA(His) guanylyltransferase n=1 Tax=Coptis chinensis TaxID=261450 RepID=A0A835IKX0_9MAGN|nr:hypothetical protein IFM89_001161 [Coptis chinensis]